MESDSNPRTTPRGNPPTGNDGKKQKKEAVLSADTEQQKAKKATAKDKKKRIINWGWAVKICVITFVISFSMSYVSEISMADVNLFPAAITLFCIVLLGALFDAVGTSVTAADAKTLNSMAAKKVHGAKAALYILSKAATVSNFCNDVIGDICGIISGSMCAVVAVDISMLLNTNTLLTTLIVTALIASFTVGLKAVGKNFALAFSSEIIHFVARVCCLIVPEKYWKSK